MKSCKKRLTLNLLHVLLVGFIVVLIYSNVLEGEFVLDDHGTVVSNNEIADISVDYLMSMRRPLGILSFSLNYLIGGFDPFGYHLINILIHILNASLVFFLIRLLFKAPVISKESIAQHAVKVAFFTSLIFAVHPIQTQAVSYITQRLESLSTLFFLTTFWFYLVARFETLKRKNVSVIKVLIYSILGMFFFICALLVKETTITLLGVIIFTDLFLFKSNKFKLKNYTFPIIIFSVLIFLGTLFIMSLPGIETPGVNASFFEKLDRLTREAVDISRTEYLLSQINAFRTYFRLLVLPINQILDYAYPKYTTFFNLSTIFSLLLFISIAYIGVHFLKYSRLVLYGMGFFVINILPTSSIFPIRDILMEHRVYLPSIGFFLACIMVYYILMEKNKNRIGQFYSRFKSLIDLNKIHYKKIIVLLLIANIYAFGTYKRNFVWQTELTMWEDVIEKAPHNWRGYANISEVYRKQGAYDQQAVAIHKAIEVGGDRDEMKYYLYNLGSYYFGQNDFDNAVTFYSDALKIDPEFAEASFFLGSIFFERSEYSTALTYFENSLSSNFYLNMPIENCWAQLANTNYRMVLTSKENNKGNETGSVDKYKNEALKYFRMLINQNVIIVDKALIQQNIDDIEKNW